MYCNNQTLGWFVSVAAVYTECGIWPPFIWLDYRFSPLCRNWAGRGVVMTYICVSGEGQDFWSSVPGQWSWGGGNLSEFTGIHGNSSGHSLGLPPADPESAGFNCPRGLISGQCLGYL